MVLAASWEAAFGTDGSATINGNQLSINVDSSAFVGETELTYHIHDKWDNDAAAFGTGAWCNGTYTGGHWDPTAACGPKSGNADCDAACIDTTGYSCNPSNYSAL